MVREYRQERSQLFERIDHLETHAREQDKKLREMEHRYERLRDATSAELAEAKAALSQCGEESRHYQKLYQIAMDALNEARKS